jgi:hypothetical protein
MSTQRQLLARHFACEQVAGTVIAFARAAMKPTKLLILCGVFTLFTASCSSGPKARVIERESGTIEAISGGEKQADATMRALDAAADYCEERGQQAVFSEDTEVNPKESRSERAISAARKLPVIGRVIASVTEDDDHSVAVEFKCK